MADRVRATVRVVMDVDAGSVWNADWPVAEIQKQAEDGVYGLLMNGNKIALAELPRRIVGRPKMVSVTVTREDTDAN